MSFVLNAEEWMLKCIFTVNSLVRIYIKAFFQQVDELIMTLKKLLDRFEVVYRSPAVEKLLCFLIWNRIIVKNLSKLRFCFFDHPMRKLTWILLNENQMLKIVMSMEQKISCRQLWNDAADRPYIGKFIPLTAFQYNFRWTILAGANDRAMKLIELSGPSKIDDSYFVRFR